MKRHEYIRQFYGLIAALTGMDMPVDAKVRAGSFGVDADVDDKFYAPIQGAVNTFPAFKAMSLTVDTKPSTNPDPATLLAVLKRGIARAAQFTEAPSSTDWKTDDALRNGVRALAQHIFEPPTATQHETVQGRTTPTAVAIVTDSVLDFVGHEMLQHPPHALILADAMSKLKTPEERYTMLERILAGHDAYLRANAASKCPPIEAFRAIVQRALLGSMTGTTTPPGDTRPN